MGEKCLPDELRTLFLFEALNDEQLAMLCEHGQIQSFEPGPIHVEVAAPGYVTVQRDVEIAAAQETSIQIPMVHISEVGTGGGSI